MPDMNLPAAPQKDYKQFKVASISKNTNSFGLNGVVLVAKDGEAWEVGAYMGYNPPPFKQGDVLTLEKVGNHIASSQHSFEIPRKLPLCPPNVVKEIWGNSAPAPAGDEVPEAPSVRIPNAESAGSFLKGL